MTEKYIYLVFFENHWVQARPWQEEGIKMYAKYTEMQEHFGMMPYPMHPDLKIKRPTVAEAENGGWTVEEEEKDIRDGTEQMLVKRMSNTSSPNNPAARLVYPSTIEKEHIRRYDSGVQERVIEIVQHRPDLYICGDTAHDSPWYRVAPIPATVPVLIVPTAGGAGGTPDTGGGDYGGASKAGGESKSFMRF